MQIYLVKSAPVFWRYSEKKMCKLEAGIFPAKDSDHDRNYCKTLESAFQTKHGSKACDLTIRLIYPVFAGIPVGTVQFWDESETLKTFKEILNDPEMTVTFRLSNKWIAGPKAFAGTEGMMLDSNETFICESQIELTPLEPHLDILLGGNNALYVTVLLNFNPGNIQDMLPEIVDTASKELVAKCKDAVKSVPSLKSGKKAAKSKKSKEKSNTLNASYETATEKSDAPVVLSQAQHYKSQEDKALHSEIAPEEENIKSADLVVKLKSLNVTSEKCQTHSENQEVKPVELNVKGEISAEVPSELSSTSVVPFELTICKKILKDRIACDMVIVAKNGRAVECHKSFLFAHSTTFASSVKKDEFDGLQNVLEMKEVSEEGVKALLAYLYYWDQTESNNRSLIAFELLWIGYKYDISLLQTAMKTILVSKPTNWYDPDVTVKLFHFARDLSSDGDELKIKAIKAMKENLSEVEQCAAYKELFKENPEVAMELCRFAFSL